LEFAISPVDAAETFRTSNLWFSFLAVCQCVLGLFVEGSFQGSLLKWVQILPLPQPGRFVSCCGHVPSVRLFHRLHDKPWSFANTVGLELCATVCAMALPAGVRRQTAAWYFDVFLAST
jgi:hypothetical protein